MAPSYLMLLNPTGGVLGGDHLVTEIIQEAGTHVCLTTPSATRIYRTARKARGPRNRDSRWAKEPRSNIFPTTSFRMRARRCANLCAWKWREAAGPSSWIRWRPAAWLTASAGVSRKWIRERKCTCAAGRPTSIGRESFPRRNGPIDRDGWRNSITCRAWDCLRMDSRDWKQVAAAMNAELKSVPNVRGGVSSAFARRLRGSISRAFRIGHDAGEQETLGCGARTSSLDFPHSTTGNIERIR